MSSVPVPLPAVLAAAGAPVTPAGASVGFSWVPYLVAGVALIAVAALVGLRSRRREAALREFLWGRGAQLLLIGLLVWWLADAASEGDGLTAVDRPVWSWLVDHRNGVVTAVAKVVTEVGSTVAMGVLAVIAVGWLVVRERRCGDAALVAVVTAGAGVLVSVSKPIVGRVRPPVEFRLVAEANQSFPSGHALASMAVLGVLAVVFLPPVSSSGARIGARVAVGGFVLAIGASRLYLGVHWPTDVLGGWLTGAGWLLTCLTVRTLLRRYPDALHRWVPGRTPGSRAAPTDPR